MSVDLQKDLVSGTRPVTNLAEFSAKWDGFGYGNNPQARLSFLHQKVEALVQDHGEVSHDTLMELADLKAALDNQQKK